MTDSLGGRVTGGRRPRTHERNDVGTDGTLIVPWLDGRMEDAEAEGGQEKCTYTIILFLGPVRPARPWQTPCRQTSPTRCCCSRPAGPAFLVVHPIGMARLMKNPQQIGSIMMGEKAADMLLNTSPWPFANANDRFHV